MAKIPFEQQARISSAFQCMALDFAETANVFRKAGEALVRFDAQLQCAALDAIECDPKFPSSDVGQ